MDVLGCPDPDWSRKPKRRHVERALRLNEDGRRALDNDDLSRAEQLFMRAIETVPLMGMPWFNLGLIYKRQRRWPEAAACNRRSIELGATEEDPAYWNLGIAATALRDWDCARWAWRQYGIDIESGEGPIVMDFGPSPVRINPDSTGEVVWGRRVDPARVVIENIPLPESGHRWHDVVLHDGEPRGERSLGDRAYPVFDELERWEPSDVPTWECLVSGPTGAIEGLERRFQSEGSGFEDWTINVRSLCTECSHGSIGVHSHGPFLSDAEGNHVGIAAPRHLADRLLDEWIGEGPDRTRTDLISIGD